MNNHFGMTTNGETTAITEQEPTSHFATISHTKKRAFLSAFVECAGALRAACRAAKVAHSLHYYWLKTDPEYVEAFEYAKTLARDMFESDSIERANKGMLRAKFDKNGNQLEWINPETGKKEKYVERHFYEPASFFHLKAMKPEKYVEAPKNVTNVSIHQQSQQKLDSILALADEFGVTLDTDSIFSDTTIGDIE